ncbi:MAG: hypothetical protein OSB09_02705 [Planctomycetota bacterium]|nr:hypothetical protein [Planctomycetota bacterium]
MTQGLPEVPELRSSMNTATALFLLLATALHPSGRVSLAPPPSLLEIQGDGQWARTLPTEVHRAISQGDQHPALFGSSLVDSSLEWNSHIRSEVIAQTVRGVLREHLLNDPEYGAGGYGSEMAQISGSGYRSGQQHQYISYGSFGGFDLGLDDPLLDGPFVGPPSDRIAAHLGAAERYGTSAKTVEEVYFPYFEVLPWTRWGAESDSRNSNRGGIRATLGLDTLSPFHCHSLRFLLTANLESGGESGVLFQICWQGNTRSP